MKNLAVLLILSSCISINSNSPERAPKAMALRASADLGSMAYGAEAVLASFKPEKARAKAIESAQSLGGTVLQDGTEFVQVRVPSESLSNYIEGLKAFGKLESFSIRGENLAEPMQDNSLRLETLRKTRQKYQDILDRAAKPADILAVTRELEQLDYQIQALQQQKAQQELRTSTAEVGVTLKKRQSFGPLGWVFYGLWRVVRWFFWWG